MERETGFEPATSTLARSHSTTELFPPAGCSHSSVANRLSTTATAARTCLRGALPMRAQGPAWRRAGCGRASHAERTWSALRRPTRASRAPQHSASVLGAERRRRDTCKTARGLLRRHRVDVQPAVPRQAVHRQQPRDDLEVPVKRRAPSSPTGAVCSSSVIRRRAPAPRRAAASMSCSRSATAASIVVRRLVERAR